jgi:hypothetical protein
MNKTSFDPRTAAISVPFQSFRTGHAHDCGSRVGGGVTPACDQTGMNSFVWFLFVHGQDLPKSLLSALGWHSTAFPDDSQLLSRLRALPEVAAEVMVATIRSSRRNYYGPLNARELISFITEQSTALVADSSVG